MARIEGITVPIEGDESNLRGSLDRAERDMRSFSRSGERALANFDRALLATTAAIGAMVTAATQLTRVVGELSGEFLTVSDSLGIQVETYQTLERAFRQAGFGGERLRTNLFQLRIQLEQLERGSAQSVLAFEGLGLAAQDFVGLEFDQSLQVIANAAAQAEANTAGFSGELQAGLQIISQYGEGNTILEEQADLLDRLLVVTRDTAVATDQFNNDLDDLATTFRNAVAQGVIGVLNDLQDELGVTREELLVGLSEDVTAAGAAFARFSGYLITNIDALASIVAHLVALRIAIPIINNIGTLGTGLALPFASLAASLTIAVPLVTEVASRLRDINEGVVGLGTVGVVGFTDVEAAAVGFASAAQRAADAVKEMQDNSRPEAFQEALAGFRGYADILQEIEVTRTRILQRPDLGIPDLQPRGDFIPTQPIDPFEAEGRRLIAERQRALEREGLSAIGLGVTPQPVPLPTDFGDALDDAAISDSIGTQLTRILTGAETNAEVFAAFSGFRDNLSSTLSGAIATGNFDNVGEALLTVLTATLTENLLNQGINFLGGALGIPGFQHGGIVPGAEGSPALVVAHAGELILNREQQEQLLNAGNGITVVQNINGRLDEQVRRSLFRNARTVGDIAQRQLSENRVLRAA